MGRIGLLICLLFWGIRLPASDPAGRFKLSEPVQMRYQETRTLALLSEPWKGSGYLLADPSGTMVKLQLSPQRVIMVATPSRLLYFDSSSGERHRIRLPTSMPQAEGIVLLRQLLQGNFQPIRGHYHIEYVEEGKNWSLQLLPKDPESAPFRKVSMHGDLEGNRQVLEIVERDGDRSVTRMVLDARGDKLTYTIARLVQEAAGE